MRRGLADHGADVGGFIERIAYMQFLDAFEQAREKLLLHAALHVNPLHGNAALPGIGESANDAAIGGDIYVRIGVHDHSSIAAQFQGDFFLAGLPFQRPAYWDASGEGEHLEAVVADQFFCFLIC